MLVVQERTAGRNIFCLGELEKTLERKNDFTDEQKFIKQRVACMLEGPTEVLVQGAKSRLTQLDTLNHAAWLAYG